MMKAYVILISVAERHGYDAERISALKDMKVISRLAAESEKDDDNCGKMGMDIFENSFNYDTLGRYSPDKVYIKFA